MSDLKSSKNREALSNMQRALLDKRLKGKKTTGAPISLAIHPRLADEPAFASPGQERVWLFQQMNPDSTAYNMFEAYRAEGDLNHDALRRSLNVVVRRHDSLRTRFEMDNDQLVQQVESDVNADVRLVDLSQLDADERETALQSQLSAAANTRFNLTRAPLFAVTVIQLGQREYVIALVVHHIISDEGSNSTFWTDLARCYEAYMAGNEPNLAELPIQYADYAQWQRARFESGDLNSQLDYWTKVLQDAPSQLSLPIDHPRPTFRIYHGGLRTLDLPDALSRDIREFAQQHSVTLPMLLMSAYLALLYRYTSQTDLVIGMPIANRNQAEIDQVIGFFLNTLPLRVTIDGGSAADLLQRVRSAMLEAFTNQEIPFDHLVDTLRPERDASLHPFFQTMFVFQDAERTARLPGVALTPIPHDQGVAKFDLTVFAADRGARLQLAAEYSSDLFDAPTIHQLLDHLQNLLSDMVARPDVPLSQLTLLSTAERQQILFDWNATEMEYPQQGLIHDLIADNAVSTPDAPALIFGGEQMSYADLGYRANLLANYLLGRGVEKGAAVGICMERSTEMFISIVALLKIGCAYVPLDPSHPSERLAYIMNDCGIKTVLTQQGIKDLLPKADRKLIPVDAYWSLIESASSDSPPVTVSADDTAYIIYTSGSTGQPKGVVITHANLRHSTLARYVYYPETVSCYLLLSPFFFDSSVAGIFWALAQGGSLCLPLPGEERNPDHLIELIEAHGVSHTLCLPSLYDILLDTAPHQLRSMRTIIVAGEACSAQVIDKHLRTLPTASLYNEYGPTEGTVWCTVHRITRDDIGKPVPIGRPIPNMQAYILDPHQQPLPVGAAGELAIAGDGLARHYLNQPELTAQKFIDFPPTARRIYRTGDLARYRADGIIEFLGRIDHQVKVRGHRIEPTEIETALLNHVDVRQVVVLSISTAGRSDSEIVAFVVFKLDADVSPKDLKKFLTAYLPDYMIPSRIHRIDSIAVNANGKTDRAVLLKYDADHHEDERLMIMPRSPEEEALAAIWSEFLGVSPISVDDDFFELGGHSLHAMRLVTRINREFKTKTTVADLIRCPTVEGFATLIRPEVTAAPSDFMSAHVVPVQAKGNYPIFWGLTRGHLGAFAYVNLSNLMGEDYPVYALRMPGLDGEMKPFDDIPALATYYITLIKQVQPRGPYYLGGYSIAGLIAFEIAHQLAAAGDEIGSLVLFDTVFYDESSTAAFREIAARTRRKWLRRILLIPRYIVQYVFMSPQQRKAWLDQRRGVIEKLSPEATRKRAVTQAIESASDRYEMTPIPTSILYFRSEEEHAKKERAESAVPDERVWARYATGGITIIDVPGDHKILSGPYVGLVADALRRLLSGEPI